MKLLSIAVPCYNSAGYMKKCISSLLSGGEDVEILIVDDGSTKDDTAAIADEYAAQYPAIVKAIHQENGGHGSAVMTGLNNASGLYFKVVDSDDSLDYEAYMKILGTLKKLYRQDKVPDMMISNYIYDKVGVTNKKVIHYRGILPKDRIFTWDECHHFRKGSYILMHSVIYRTKLLKDCGLDLPKHTFYVDNLYVFKPLPYVKTMYYLDVDFYKYYIGRDDQSVNETVMISRMDQQVRVNKMMIDYMVDNKKLVNKNSTCHKYMLSYLEIITTVSGILMLKSGTQENMDRKAELWNYIKDRDKELYKRLRYAFLGIGTNLPGKVGRKISVMGYSICRKIFNFN
ncbi:MAG: glycosyltransferase [Lachnospiraceae bacterium]|nr:glycosyltransferase [Lachnospiraceae bacterium]